MVKIDGVDLMRSSFRLRQLAADLNTAADTTDALFDLRVKVGAVIGEMQEQAFEANPHSDWTPDRLKYYVAKLQKAMQNVARHGARSQARLRL